METFVVDDKDTGHFQDTPDALGKEGWERVSSLVHPYLGSSGPCPSGGGTNRGRRRGYDLCS